MNARAWRRARRTRQMPAAAPNAIPPQIPSPPSQTAKTPYQWCGMYCGGGDVEVDPAADDAAGTAHRATSPTRPRIAALRPAALGDQDRQRNPDHIHQPINVHRQRPQDESRSADGLGIDASMPGK